MTRSWLRTQGLSQPELSLAMRICPFSPRSASVNSEKSSKRNNIVMLASFESSASAAVLLGESTLHSTLPIEPDIPRSAKTVFAWAWFNISRVLLTAGLRSSKGESNAMSTLRPLRAPAKPPTWSKSKWVRTNRSIRLTPSWFKQVSIFGSNLPTSISAIFSFERTTVASPCPTSQLAICQSC